MNVGLYPEIAKVARKHGYALAAHGSTSRELDLVAIPWTQYPGDPEDIVEELLSTFAITLVGDPEVKFHGRKCWTLAPVPAGCAVQFSVMPREAAPRPPLESRQGVLL